ncbi:MAG: CPBP family intramembrane glutamic endopeptidase [Rhodospirillales bacterium]
MTRIEEPGAARMEPRLLLLLSAAILFAGWAKFLFDGHAVYVLDYLSRGVCLAVVLWSRSLAGLAAPPSRWVRALLLTGVIFLVALGAYQFYRYFEVPDPVFYQDLFPRLEEGAFRTFDLTVGLVLVALSEEVVFRYLFAILWQHRGWSVPMLYVASSFAFGLLHLPQGLALVAFATVTGFLLMFLYRDSGSLWPVVAVHYALNLLIFSGAGCDWGVTDCLAT